MSIKTAPKKGDKLWMTFVQCRVSVEGPATCVARGPKFFKVKFDKDRDGPLNYIPFRVSDFREETKYASTYSLWESEQAFQDYCERQQLCAYLRKKVLGFGASVYSLEFLRKVKSLIEFEQKP